MLKKKMPMARTLSIISFFAILMMSIKLLSLREMIAFAAIAIGGDIAIQKRSFGMVIVTIAVSIYIFTGVMSFVY